MDTRTTHYHVRRREFLSEDPVESEFIIGIVQDTTEYLDDDPEEPWHQGIIRLEFGNGFDSLTFYFDMRSPAERVESLRKIGLMAEVVNAVKAGIALEAESRDLRPGQQTCGWQSLGTIA